MADLPPYPDTDDTGVERDCGSTTSRPWRVYVLWSIGIALVLLVVVLHLTGVVGPGSHIH